MLVKGPLEDERSCINLLDIHQSIFNLILSVFTCFVCWSSPGARPTKVILISTVVLDYANFLIGSVFYCSKFNQISNSIESFSGAGACPHGSQLIVIFELLDQIYEMPYLCI